MQPGFPKWGRLVGGQFGRNAQKLHENDKVSIFGSKQLGDQFFGYSSPPLGETLATIMDNKSLTFELEQMVTKGLIDQNYKILIRGNLQINTEPSPDKVSFTIVGRNTDQENAITNESVPFIVSQDTLVTKSKSTSTCKNIESTGERLTFVNSQTTSVIKTISDTSCNMRKSPTALEVDNLRANMMAIKSFFMNEIYGLRQEISSLQLKLQQEKLNHSGNNNVCKKDEKIIIEDLKTKLDFYQNNR